MARFNKFLVGACVASLSSAAMAGDWKYGIGTGITALDVDGDGGFASASGAALDFDASLSPDEVNEYMESAFGLAGMATNGDWTITAAAGALELEEDVDIQGASGSGNFEINFETVGAEVLANYTFSRSGKSTWGAIGGVRYTSQEYKGTWTGGVGSGSRSVDEDWTDAVIGLSYGYAISPTLVWSSQVDYGVGGSEGTTHASTGISKVFGENWLVRGYVDVKEIEFENGNRGDADWFLYDATETKLGVAFMYLF